MQTSLIALAALAFLTPSLHAQPADAPVELDLLLRGGTVYTGDDDRPVVGDVGIAGDRIVFAGRAMPAQFKAKRTIDATGMVVAPGFIDAHTHADTDLHSNDARKRLNIPFLTQGVTTAVIGNDVTLYHAVTLGGISPSEDSQSQVGVKRHPTLGKGVIVGSGAQVLGPITIGMNTRIGANSVVTKDIPPAVTVVGIPARTMMPRDKKKAHEFQAYGTPADDYPDPVVQAIDNLRGQVAQLMKRIEDLEIVVETPMAAEERGSGGQSRGKNEKGKQPAA